MDNLVDIFAKPKYLANMDNPEVAIVQENELAAFASKMSFDLKTIVTVIWFKDDGALVRDDNYAFGSSMRPTCRLLRYYASEVSRKNRSADVSPCYKCDEYYIGVLREKLSELDSSLTCSNKRSQIPKPSFFGIKYQELNLLSTNVFVDGKKLHYLKYKCPMLGYTELEFPVIIEGNFLGVIYIGQNISKNDIDAESTFNEFLTTNAWVFGARPHINKLNFRLGIKKQEYRRSKLLRVVRNAELSIAEKHGNKNEISNINDLVKSSSNHKTFDEKEICKLEEDGAKQIEWLHSELSTRLRALRKKKIEPLVNDMSQKLEEHFCKISGSEFKDSDLRYFFDAFKENGPLSAILTSLGIISVTILGNQKNPGDIADYMQEIYSSKKCEHRQKVEFDISFAYSGARPTHPWQPILSILSVDCPHDSFDSITQADVDKIFSRIVGGNVYENRNNYMFLFFDAWMVLFEIKGCHNADIYRLVLQDITIPMAGYLSRYEKILFDLTARNNAIVLDLYQHEIGRIANSISTKFAVIKSKTGLDKNQDAKRKAKDIDDNITQIAHLSDTIKILLDKPLSGTLFKPESFSLLNDVIYKWQTSLKESSHGQDKLISVLGSQLYENSVERNIVHVKRLVDLFIYNIMENAAKYAYSNTTIIIELESSELSNIHISISSLGPEVKTDKIDGEQILFKKHYRAVDTTHLDGDGLGLYICKIISDKFGMGVKYSCKQLQSDSNETLLTFKTVFEFDVGTNL